MTNLKQYRPFLYVLVPGATLLGGLVAHVAITEQPYLSPSPEDCFGIALLFGHVSLFSVWAALGPTRLSIRVSGLVAGFGVFGLASLSFFSNHDAWVYDVLALIQMAMLIIILGTLRLRGTAIRQDGVHDGLESNAAGTQFTIQDLLILVTACGVLFGVARCTEPRDIPSKEWYILAVLGFCFTLVTLSALWSSMGTAPLVLRIGLFVVVAPSSGYATGRLLTFGEAWFWPCLTGLQGIFVAVSLLVFRAHGYSIVRRTTTAP